MQSGDDRQARRRRASDITVPGGPTGEVSVRIVRPRGATGPLPVILYIHGAGWVFGNAHTHDRLVRELAVGAERRGRLPRVRPLARGPATRPPIEQNYAVAQWVAARRRRARASTRPRIAVAGDSVGGNMTAALTLMAKERGDVRARASRCSSTRSPTRASTPPPTTQFAEGYFLRRDAHAVVLGPVHDRPGRSAPRSPPRRCAPPPSSSPACRRRWSSPARPTCCATRARPTRTSCARPASPVTAVRYQGIIHDFVMLNALRDTNAAGAAIDQAIGFLGARLGA